MLVTSHWNLSNSYKPLHSPVNLSHGFSCLWSQNQHQMHPCCQSHLLPTRKWCWGGNSWSHHRTADKTVERPHSMLNKPLEQGSRQSARLKWKTRNSYNSCRTCRGIPSKIYIALLCAKLVYWQLSSNKTTDSRRNEAPETTHKYSEWVLHTTVQQRPWWRV